MLSPISFQSEKYAEIQWKELFENAGKYASKLNEPMGLVNASGLIMATDFIYTIDRLGLCFEKNVVEIFTDATIIPFTAIEKPSILFFQLKFKYLTQTVSSIYLKFLNKIVFDVFQICNNMLLYTYDHLSQREYDNQSLLKIETIQMQLVEIYTELESVRIFLTKENDKQTVAYLISRFIKILNQIAKLGGARAILKNNAIELLFYLKIFQRFITTE